MIKKSKGAASWLQTTTVRVTRVHFVFVAAYVASIVIFDSWNLYTHDAVGELWTAAGILLVINTLFWYISRSKYRDSVYIAIVQLLVLADIAFAAYNVYWQQGLSSKSVALFAVPIVAAAALRSRSTLLAAASLSSVAYSVVTVRYFFDHYGESYRVELWGTVGFYCAVFFVLAGLLMIVVRPTDV